MPMTMMYFSHQNYSSLLSFYHSASSSSSSPFFSLLDTQGRETTKSAGRHVFLLGFLRDTFQAVSMIGALPAKRELSTGSDSTTSSFFSLYHDVHICD